MNSKRLFFALWPDDNVREQLAAAGIHLSNHHGRPTPSCNLHLTLAFLGQTPDSRLPLLLHAASAVSGTAFSLTLSQWGWWRKAGVLYLAPDPVPVALLDLVAGIRDSASTLGIALDQRPYSPHVTVARILQGTPRPLVFQPVVWQCRDFCLLESVPARKGVAYSILGRWPLANGKKA